MEYKPIIIENEKEIINKGNKGETFANLEEAEIYLKHLLNNRNCYIEGAFLHQIGNRRVRYACLGVITFFAAFPFATSIISNNIPLLLYTLKVAGTLSSPFIIYDRIQSFIVKRQVIKAFDSNVHALKVKCGYVDEDEDEAVLEDIKTVVKKVKVKEQIVDNFIANIRDDMYKIADIKYLGYEQDLQTLYELAEDYLEEKRRLGTTSDSFALAQDPKWFKSLVAIEDKIKKASKIRQDQETNMEVLSQIKEKLYQEKIDLKLIQSQEKKAQKKKLMKLYHL